MSVTDIELSMDEEATVHRPLLSPVPPSSVPAFIQVENTSQSKRHQIVACRDKLCSSIDVCPWHNMVLKYPQCVRWEAVTIAVKLEKGGASTFGFHYKKMVTVS